MFEGLGMRGFKSNTMEHESWREGIHEQTFSTMTPSENKNHGCTESMLAKRKMEPFILKQVQAPEPIHFLLK
jgi:hypothetical protein